MDEKTKELIAIGASITAHCNPCLSFHVDKAKDLGTCEDEIKEAIAVGQQVEKGSMSAMRKFSDEVFDTPSEEAPSACSGA